MVDSEFIENKPEELKSDHKSKNNSEGSKDEKDELTQESSNFLGLSNDSIHTLKQLMGLICVIFIIYLVYYLVIEKSSFIEKPVRDDPQADGFIENAIRKLKKKQEELLRNLL